MQDLKFIVTHVNIAVCSRNIHGKACVVTAAQSQGSRVATSMPAASASTSGRAVPAVRPPMNSGRGRQSMVRVA